MSRSHALKLYRALLREAARMPTANRKRFVQFTARRDFEANRGLQDANEIELALGLAETQLDTVRVQRQHLADLKARGLLDKCAPRGQQPE